MIKVYNPDLIGFSVGFGSYKWKNSHLNLAIPGDEARSVTYLRPSAPHMHFFQIILQL
jgi:hypothetical protein